MSDALSIFIGLTAHEVFQEVARAQAAIDQQAAEWKVQRLQMINDMQQIAVGINQLFAAVRMAYRIAGEAINPIFGALMATISASVSLMLATASAIAVGSVGILGWISIALSAAAVGYQFAETAKVIAAQAELRRRLDARGFSLRRREASLGSIAGSFGGFI